MSDLLNQMLERNARKYPNDWALICHVTDTKLSWQELNFIANQLAYVLREKGISAKDHVGLFYSNQVEFVVSLFAVLKLGAAAVPINVRLTSNEVEGIIQSINVNAIIYHPTMTNILEVNNLSITVLPFSIKDKEQFVTYSNKNLNVDISSDDIAEILLTSGTTGYPKGVMLSHDAVYQSGMMMAYEMGIYKNDRVLQLMPLTHSAPLNLMFFGAIFSGATSILENFTPQNLLQYTETDQTTHFFGAPIAYLLALKLLAEKQYNLTSMKKWIYGGAPMPSNYLNSLKAKFPGEFVGVYGLTEAGPNGLALYHEEHENHIGTIGRRATINTEFRVVNDKSEDQAVGDEGEILLKTSSIMTGYYNNPEATKEAIIDGWLYTGDIGKVDKDGYLHIIDRKKDVIISGGENIYPSEVEKIILTIEGVADATVISKPHDEWGETAIAVVVKAQGAELTEKQIIDFLKDKLAKYKIPREVLFLAEVPRNASGKILKHRLREMYR